LRIKRQVAALLNSGTDYVCIVGKSSKLHILKALQTDVDNAISMAVDTVNYLKKNNIKFQKVNLDYFSDNKNPSILLGSLYLIGEYKKRN